MRDYYEILGIGRDASPEVLKQAYRKEALKYHPDRNPGDAEAETKFKEAAEAYEVLSDSQKRANYDRFGHAGLRNGRGQGPRFTDVNDVFSTFSDIFGSSGHGSIFDEFFGGPGRSRRAGGARGRRGEALRVPLSLTLQEIAEGAKKRIKVHKKVACERCNATGADGGVFDRCDRCGGSGEVREARNTIMGHVVSVRQCSRCGGEGRAARKICRTCNGEGRTNGQDTISVNIPAGVVEGMALKVRGGGNAGWRGGPAGYLRVEIREIEDERFVREGHDIYHNAFVSFPDAALGTELEVPTLKGKARIKVDPGTQSGKLLRMRGRGLVDVNTGRSGDQFIRIHVWTPRSLSADEKRVLGTLRRSPAFAPRPEKDQKSFFNRVKDVFS